MRFRLQRVAKKNHEIQVIVLNLCAELLLTTQVSGEILVNREVGDLFNEASRCPGCKQRVLRKYSSVSDTKVLHQLLFCIMCNQSDIHTAHSSFFL